MNLTLKSLCLALSLCAISYQAQGMQSSEKKFFGVQQEQRENTKEVTLHTQRLSMENSLEPAALGHRRYLSSRDKKRISQTSQTFVDHQRTLTPVSAIESKRPHEIQQPQIFVTDQ